VKHELKGVLKYRDKNFTPDTQTVIENTIDRDRYHSNAPSQIMTDIAAKTNPMVSIIYKTIEFKLPVFGPFPGLPVTCYDKHLSLRMRNSQTDTYFVESPNPGLSCFTGIARDSFF